METADICRVEGCERRAAASVTRDDLPGGLRLCATHTEDFRMNGERWTITQGVPGTPPVVRPAPLAAVGRTSPGPAAGPVTPVPLAGRVKTLMATWLHRRP